MARAVRTRRTKKAVLEKRAKRLPVSMWTKAGIFISLLSVGLIYALAYSDIFAVSFENAASAVAGTGTAVEPLYPPLDKTAYDAKLLSLAHVAPLAATSSATTTTARGVGTATTTKKLLWPAPTVYPEPGAILPFHRIVAYYGNFYSTGMGVLGQYPAPQMLARLASTTALWNTADPSTPVVPAIEYIAVTAQGYPGKDGMYRLRMPDDQIDHALDLAQQVNGIVILDIQPGLSTVETEVPLLQKYLSLPQVHLALDPEFSMKTGAPPGTVIGSLDAADINWVATYLAKLVEEDHLPPKVLIIHRFTQAMVTRTASIKPLPQVEIVMNMDGWGTPQKKIGTYNAFINPEPVEFTGFKLFYKNDLKPPSPRLLSPQEIMALTPAPSYIQYQ